MNKTVKVIFGVCIVLILAAGAFFASSTYYGSKQKDAQLVSMKKESSIKESKYLSSKIKDKKIKDKQESKKSSSKKAAKSDNQTEVSQAQVSQSQADTTTEDQNPQSPDNWSAPNDNPEWDAIYSGFQARAATADGPMGVAGPVDKDGNPLLPEDGQTIKQDDDGNLYIADDDSSEYDDEDY